ncbi:Permease of the drug/metabolite transporter (DMT) superfamily [Albimonas donghaensis]|uniref:Permease of the drug/metabolite transporter (DMT) superfamily n=2 Tax=Albimonas donghaensis TaxID=356660 RepID=A0A1H3EZQ7_9RHOB|nr:Permease of the drug/metabolite transporter (DMT) superfamily [Albimonas donghaensis]
MTVNLPGRAPGARPAAPATPVCAAPDGGRGGGGDAAPGVGAGGAAQGGAAAGPGAAVSSQMSGTELKTTPVAAWKGYAAVVFSVVVWAGWIVVTRAQGSTLAPVDTSILRIIVPALLLSPVWLRRGIVPKGQPQLAMWIMAAGWGAPFILLISKGLETVPAALFGPMVPATLPLLVGLWDYFVAGRKVRGVRLAGLGLIAVSIALVVGPAALRGDGGFFIGAPYLVAAACGWTAFTIAYRATTLTGLEAAAYMSLYSAPFLLVLAAVEGLHLQDLSLGEFAWYFVAHGVLAGVGSIVAYGYAMRVLGVARTSAFASLVPMGAALGGLAVLGEAPAISGWFSVGCACLGVAAVNGVFGGMEPARND